MLDKILQNRVPQKIGIYILGLFVLAFGVALSINSRLGVSPVNSIPYIVGRIFDTDPGMWTTAMFVLFILIQIAILRKDFKPFHVVQIIFATLFGLFLDFTLWLQGGFQIPTYFGQLAMLIMSIILIAAGLVLIISAKIVALPPEALCLAITGKISGAKFHNVKIIVDSTLVLIAIALSLIFLSGIDGIREGTVLSAILIGKIIPPIRKALTPLFRWAYKEEEHPQQTP